jgi:N-acetylglucosaminyldiphosphoundecaprenol N-acetyl-beta-D-mannosaminyltransferase
MTKIEKQNRVRVVSLFPDVVTHDATIAKVAELVESKRGGYVCFSTVHMTMEAHDDAEFASKVNDADLIVTDGMPIVWMQKLQGRKGASRVRANDMMIALCAFAETNNLSVGFYGGRQEVIEKMVERAQNDHPNLKIAYAFSPPFRASTESEDAEITNEINRKQPDILFMGLGCPKQENWMAAHKEKLTAVMLGVGASFDFYAGNVRESPEWIGKLGLEWLFRFTQEPRRLWKRYLILNPRFLWLAAKQLIGLKKFEEK